MFGRNSDAVKEGGGKYMRYFDANAMVGAHFAPRGDGSFPGARDILDEMDFYKIDEALVYHGLAREYDLRIGNRELMKCVKESARLHPCWVIGVEQEGGMPAPRELMDELAENNVKAVRLFIGGLLSDSPVLDALLYGDLLAELENHGYPVFLEFEGNSSISGRDVVQLDEVLKSFPGLQVVLLSPRTTGLEMKLISVRMERFGNLHMGLSGFHGNYLIEDMTARFGPKRFLFDTCYPWFSPAQVKIALSYADIPREAREAVAYGNLKRLISGRKE
jgi:hypothetical protein